MEVVGAESVGGGYFIDWQLGALRYSYLSPFNTTLNKMLITWWITLHTYGKLR